MVFLKLLQSVTLRSATDAQGESLKFRCSFLLSKVPSYTPYLRPWRSHLSIIWYIVDLSLVPEPIKVFVKLVHQELRYDVSDGTCECKKINLNFKLFSADAVPRTT